MLSSMERIRGAYESMTRTVTVDDEEGMWRSGGEMGESVEEAILVGNWILYLDKAVG
jgi:hypothetical protein